MNMRLSIRWFLILPLLLAPFGSLYAESTRPPNIILIFVDDLGYMDVGYQGTDFYETPNIDRLAKQGMVFTAGYAAAGNCQPSRACLLSGQYTPRHDVYAVASTERGPRDQMRLVPVPNKSGLAPELVSMADALRSSGYATGIFGKWHLGGPDGCEPGEQGFDVVIDQAQKGSGTSADPKSIFHLTDEVIRFIESNRDRPFFAYLSHHAIHTGLQARESTIEHFRSKPKGEKHTANMYGACLFDLDAGIGRLLERLQELGLEDNTLVVFTSDNGATNQSLQEPLRGNKGSYHEGGIRVPFIVRWPGVVPAGSTCDTPIIHVDLYPTFLATAGAEPPAEHILDGESLLPLLKQSGPLNRKAIYWHFPGYLDSPVIRGRDPLFRTRPVTVVNAEHWKLYLYHEEWQLDGGQEKIETNHAAELYDLKSDLGERKDLSQSHPEKRDELLRLMHDWFRRTGARMPDQPNPNYRPDAQDAAGR